jgi:hypothetical protein
MAVYSISQAASCKPSSLRRVTAPRPMKTRSSRPGVAALRSRDHTSECGPAAEPHRAERAPGAATAHASTRATGLARRSGIAVCPFAKTRPEIVLAQFVLVANRPDLDISWVPLTGSRVRKEEAESSATSFLAGPARMPVEFLTPREDLRQVHLAFEITRNISRTSSCYAWT